MIYCHAMANRYPIVLLSTETTAYNYLAKLSGWMMQTGLLSLDILFMQKCANLHQNILCDHRRIFFTAYTRNDVYLTICIILINIDRYWHMKKNVTSKTLNIPLYLRLHMLHTIYNATIWIVLRVINIEFLN